MNPFTPKKFIATIATAIALAGVTAVAPAQAADRGLSTVKISSSQSVDTDGWRILWCF
ncbi:hypothetical protein ACTQ49_09310 [Luteococcus sp. Sow4_B9]|uniref:hypothetical protein n=1 Tax=Luteococcus sp. Sow4_B9 TaxID=3438792 RepID=UPI003F9D86FD